VKSVVIKKGTQDWWTWVALIKMSERERKRLRLPPGASVTLSVQQLNGYLQGLNLLKRLWLLLTIGDLRPPDRSKLGKHIALETEDGVIRHFARD